MKIIDIISITESNCALKFVFLRPVFYVFIVDTLVLTDRLLAEDEVALLSGSGHPPHR